MQWDGLRGQLDLPDPFTAPAPTMGLLLATVGGLLVAVAIAALATEPAHRTPSTEPPAPELPRRAVTADTSYVDVPGGSRAMVAVLVCGLAVPAVLGSWWVFTFGVVCLAPVAARTRFRTHLDLGGLRVTSLGMTLVHVPLAEIAGARPLEHLDAFWEFGGWGLRVDNHGRTGVVARSGPALALERADGSEVVVSVSDAGRAAGPLNALADLRLSSGER